MELGPQLLVKLEKLNVHKCDKCPKVFLKLNDLMKHNSYHDERFLSHATSAYVPVVRAKIFKCDSCTQSFGTNRDYMLHKLAHIQENVKIERKVNRLQEQDDIVKPYKCPDCDIKFAAKSILDEHSILHLPFPNICMCGIGFYKEYDLKCHIKLVHGAETEESKPKIKPSLKVISVKKKPVTVKTDDTDSNEQKPKTLTAPNTNIDFRKTPDKRYVTTHYCIHSGECTYSCHLCQVSFSRSSTLKVHNKRKHTVLEKSKYCPKAFTCLSKKKYEIILSAVKTYRCKYCGKEFHNRPTLVCHERIHTEEKRYHCPYCPKAFTDVSSLNFHKTRHENKRKPFQCVCYKKFCDRSSQKRHISTNFVCATIAKIISL